MPNLQFVSPPVGRGVAARARQYSIRLRWEVEMLVRDLNEPADEMFAYSLQAQIRDRECILPVP